MMDLVLLLVTIATTISAVVVICRKKKTGPAVVPSAALTSEDSKLPEWERLTEWEKDLPNIGENDTCNDSIGDPVNKREYYEQKAGDARRERERKREEIRREKIARGEIVEAPCDDKDKVFKGKLEFKPAEIFVPADVIEETDAKEPEGGTTVGGASEVSKKDGGESKVSAKESAKSRKTEASTVNGNETTGGNTTNVKSQTTGTNVKSR